MFEMLVGLAGGLGAAVIGAGATLRARRAPKSRLQLVDVSLPLPDSMWGGELALSRDLDVKVRNTGGQPAVVKQLVVDIRAVAIRGNEMDLRAYRPPLAVAGALPVSETYAAVLPPPREAAGSRIVIDVSQVVPPGDADRFLVRLSESSSGMVPYLWTGDFVLAYLLRLELVFDEASHVVTSAPLAVTFLLDEQGEYTLSTYFPEPSLFLRLHPRSADEFKSPIRRFQEQISEVRLAVDGEMKHRGLTPPDWVKAAPRHRRDLPGGLSSLDGTGSRKPGGHGNYAVTDSFWNPQRAIERYGSATEQMYRDLVEVVTSAAVLDDVLGAALPQAKSFLSQLPALRTELCPPSASSSEPDSE